MSHSGGSKGDTEEWVRDPEGCTSPWGHGGPSPLQKKGRSTNCHQPIQGVKVQFEEVKGDNLSTDKIILQSVKHSSNQDR